MELFTFHKLRPDINKEKSSFWGVVGFDCVYHEVEITKLNYSCIGSSCDASNHTNALYSLHQRNLEEVDVCFRISL